MLRRLAGRNNLFTLETRDHIVNKQVKGQSEGSGSGFAISGKLILTNAHVVADNSFATVQRHGSSERYKCSVTAVGHECDLALLSVEDQAFWEQPSPLKPLELGDIPQLQDDVIVLGYPTGGTNLCVTQGVVSRVGMTPYAHVGTNLLAVQIDAAINPGNSGGPALKDGKVVGVAFQDMENAENVGYIIPVPIICHFLEEVEREGCYRGVSGLGVRCQPLENPAARRALGMQHGQTGVLVVSVLPLAPAASKLLPGDVLLSFDGTPVANDGTILFRRRERISFDHLVTLKVPGDPARVTVLRGGEVMKVVVHPRPLPSLVPRHLYEQRPSYYIFGGLVFTPLTQPYLREWGEEGEGDSSWETKCPQNLYHLAMNAEAQEEGEQVIILSQVLADDDNFGYGRLENLQLLEVDGVRVKSMRHLVQLLGDSICSRGGATASGQSQGSADDSWQAAMAQSGQQQPWWRQARRQHGGEHQQQCLEEEELRRGRQETQQAEQPEQQQQQQQGPEQPQRRRQQQQQERGKQQQAQGQQQQQPWPGLGGQRFVRFVLERNQVIILDRLEAEQALSRILHTHRIPARCSEELSSEAGRTEAAAAGRDAAALAA
ncbi:hypothetical protein N2152v2_001993 [Parachlorella kessleri]